MPVYESANIAQSPTHAYTYDPAGNWNSSLAFVQNTSYTPDGLNEYTSINRGGFQVPNPSYDDILLRQGYGGQDGNVIAPTNSTGNISARYRFSRFGEPKFMKRYCLFVMMHLACLLNLNGASPIEELAHTEIPFVGERSSGVVTDESGRNLSVRYTTSVTEVVISKNGRVEGVLKLNKDISIYNVRWFDGLPWFILRERVGSGAGSLVIAIVEFKGLGQDPEFLYYTHEVATQNTTGRIFELSGVDKDKVRVIASFHDPKNQTFSYLKGSILRSKLEKADVERILIDDSFQTPSPVQEGEMIREEPLPARRVE